MKHSEKCQCTACQGIHPPLVLWQMGESKVLTVEQRDGVWYVNYIPSKRGKPRQMGLYEWNIQALQYNGT